MKHFARKRFGQHFLVDRSVLERIVAAIDPRPGDDILEIGPGPGALTALLIAGSGNLRAIEIDRDLAQALRARFPQTSLDLVEGDALKFDYASLPPGVRLVGNLPYNISTPLLFRVSVCSDRLRDLHFMLQKEVVARMAAAHSTRDYGRLSVMLQHRFRVERLFDVPPGAFRPAPQVESSMVRLTPRSAAERGEVDEESLRRVVSAAFSHRRKTLENALFGLVPATLIAARGIEPGLRPENLSPADYIALALELSRQEGLEKNLPIPKA
jgi:16S rRNA (adenine1518-N6/adenine1519-N6)-dimethyltransferase